MPLARTRMPSAACIDTAHLSTKWPQLSTTFDSSSLALITWLRPFLFPTASLADQLYHSLAYSPSTTVGRESASGLSAR